MRVLVTGATGYIGGAVADALREAGHEVVGLARSNEAAGKLEARGIPSRRGDMHDPESISRAVRDADAVVHTALSRGPDIPHADTQAMNVILRELEGTRKSLIYTSGVWVLGNTGERVADEETQPKPIPLVAWRPALENRVLAAAKTGTRSGVLRPALVYGRGGGVVRWMLHEARQRGVVSYIGSGENRWSMVHLDDLARLYVRFLERAPAGTLLNAANRPSIPAREVAEALRQTAGPHCRLESMPLEEARRTLGPRADAFVLDQEISSERAMRLLDWQPQGPSVLQELQRGSYAN